MQRSRAVVPAFTAVLVAVLAGCSAATAAPAGTSAANPRTASPSTAKEAGGLSGPSARPAAKEKTAPHAPAPRIVNATLTIPSIDVKDLRVVPYKGTTDDWPGTRIQNRGIAASPYGPHGGVGPGQVGNYLITGHRLSAGGPLHRVPEVKTGAHVFIKAGGTVYEYRITETRKTSFRSASSLAEQRAAVPGVPGRQPTRAMITVSTCATVEDNAAGNFWRDSRDNPEHRIDKVGVLVNTEKAAPGPTTS
jgi:sortase A